MHPRIRPQRGRLGDDQHFVNGGHFLAQLGSRCFGRAGNRRSFGCDFLLGLKVGFAAVVLKLQPFDLAGRAAVDKGLGRGLDGLILLAIDQPLQRFPVRFKGPCKSRDRRQQALLQADKGELRKRGLLRRQLGDARLPQFAIACKATPEIEFRRIRGQSQDGDGLDLSLGKGFAKAPQV